VPHIIRHGDSECCRSAARVRSNHSPFFKSHAADYLSRYSARKRRIFFAFLEPACQSTGIGDLLSLCCRSLPRSVPRTRTVQVTRLARQPPLPMVCEAGPLPLRELL